MFFSSQAQQEKTSNNSKKKDDSANQARQVLKQTRIIPNLIFKIEAFEKDLIKLTAKYKVNNLLQELKLSTARDFRVMKVVPTETEADEQEEEQLPDEDESGSDGDDDEVRFYFTFICVSMWFCNIFLSNCTMYKILRII